ncbi:MAG: trypsin-like peptidase domain-containing protein, partial [Clostridia bacterium]|nr:trypsin-like peptidase domain-containing protein [Clostridia bacterium]
MKKLLSLFLALMLALSCLYVQAESFASDYAAMNDAAASVLVLTLYDENDKELGTASGFMAFDERHAVTTWLAVSSAKRIKAVSDEGKELGAFKLLGCDSDCNLAILAFDESTGLKPLPLNAEEGVKRGAACVSIGAQNGYNSITTGNIANSFTMEGMDLIQFTASISDGASGGALLDENGKVAAVTMFGLSGEIGYTVVQNMNFALSARHIAELWYYCKDDEPVELENWGITDISADSPYSGAGKEFTVINDSGYKLSAVRIRAVSKVGGRYETVASVSMTWVDKGTAIDFALENDTELSEDAYVEFQIEYSGSYGKGTITKRY